MHNVVVKDAAVGGTKDGDFVMLAASVARAIRPASSRPYETRGGRDIAVISINAGSSGDDLSLWFGVKTVRKIICCRHRRLIGWATVSRQIAYGRFAMTTSRRY